MKFRNALKLSVLNLASQIGLNPSELSFKEGPSKLIRILRFITPFVKRQDYYLIISYKKSKYCISFFFKNFYNVNGKNLGTDVKVHMSPGEKALFKEKAIEHRAIFDKTPQDSFFNKELEYYVRQWLTALEEELTAITKIEKVLNIPRLMNERFDYANDEFTIQEKKQLKSGLVTLKEQIIVEFDLTDYKLNLVNKKLDELIVKVDSMNKFDFKSIFIGLLVNLASSVLYDNYNKLWELVKEIFPNNLKIR